MAELTPKTINELPSASSLSDGDLFPISSSGASKKTLWSTIKSTIKSAIWSEATSTSSVPDSDLFLINSSGTDKKVATSTLKDVFLPIWSLNGYVTGTSTVYVNNFNTYKEVFIQVVYAGYCIPIYLPVNVFATSERAIGFYFPNGYTGIVRYIVSSDGTQAGIRLEYMLNSSAQDVSSSTEVDVLAR